MAKKAPGEELVIVDSPEVLPAPRRLRLPLQTSLDVRREMARVYRSMRAGELSTQDGGRMANVLNLLRLAIETSDLERRLEHLESTQEAEKLRDR